MWWWGLEFGWVWMIFGGLMMLVFWGGLIALIVLAVRSLSGPRQRPAGPCESPLEILQRRYAAGEISKAEYEEMRGTLQE